MPDRPPRLFETLLVLCRGEVGRDIAADLSEEFASIATQRGRRSARWWYRRQVVRSIGARTAARFRRRVGDARLPLVPRPPAARVGLAVRSLCRAPWYSATVIAVVALSLALATTVFAVVDGLLFKPLPYADPERLVLVEPRFARDPASRSLRISPADVEGWQAAIPDIPLTALRVADATGLERVNEPGLGLALVRPNLLDVLGVRPFIGGFTADDLALLAAERPPVRPVLITYELWQTRFDGDIGAVGQVIDPVNPMTSPIRIAGILPPGFVVPAGRPAQFVMPSPSRHVAYSLRDTVLLARLPAGVTAAALSDRIEAAMRQWAGSVPDAARAQRLPDRAVIRPLSEGLDPWEGPALRALFASVAILVLIACLNVSGLLTARCLDRGRDIGLRRAIGARTRDIVALLLTEHALLFLIGAALGTAAAVPLLRLVVALLPPALHLLKPPVFDVRVAAFVALAVILTLFLASLWPIRRALKPDLQQLVAGPGGTAVTLRASGWGTWIVTTGQVAGTIVLIVAGGLLVGSLLQVKANDVGYRIDDVVVAELAFTPWVDGNLASNRRPEIKIRLDRFLDELRPIPGVLAAGAADVGVLESSLAYASRFDPVNPARPPDASHPPGTFWVGESGGLKIPVTPGFLRAAGMAPIAGRLPTDDELRSGAPVVAISRSYAREHFPGRDPIGAHLRHQPEGSYPTFEVVGVVEDPRLMRWDARASSSVFTSYATFGGNPDPVLFVHAGGSIDTVMAEIVRRAEAQRPMLRPVRVQTASVALNDTIRERRLQSWLFGSFAVAGLVLAGVGLFGLVAMTMARRTREIGIRMALGATRERLVTGLVSEQVAPVLIGLVAGAVLAAWAVRFLEAYVYELSLYDARVWIAALAVVGATALAGALIPSLRGSRVDPVRALRVE